MNSNEGKTKNGNKTPLEILIRKIRGVDVVTQDFQIKNFLEIHTEKGEKLSERRAVVICNDLHCSDKKTLCEHHLQFTVDEENFKISRFFCLEDNVVLVKKPNNNNQKKQKNQ